MWAGDAIHQPIDAQPEPLLWVRSPIEPDGFGGLMAKLGLDGKLPCFCNSGMLYLRRDFLKEYRAAAAECERVGFNPRMIGNAAFNVMLRRMDSGDHAESPYYNDVLWHERDNPIVLIRQNGRDLPAYHFARAVHYCNDHGKQRRHEVDADWIYCD